MAIPEPLLYQAISVSESFGGTEVLRKRLTEEQLVRILLYPSDVVVVKAWTEEDHLHDEYHICSGEVCVDPECVNPDCTCVTGVCVCVAVPETPVILNLRNYGMTGNTFSVFNSDMEFLYLGYNERGEFGPDPRDVEVLLRSPHATTLYVKFDTQYAEKLILLWCCTELSPQERRAVVDQELYLREAANLDAKANELYVVTSGLRQTGRLAVYFLPQAWIPLVSYDNIRTNPLTEVDNYSVENELALVNLERSGWFLFEHWINGYPVRTLKLDNLVGAGVRRIRSTEDGLYFLDLTNNALRPSDLQQSAFGSAEQTLTWTEMDKYVRVEASFRY